MKQITARKAAIVFALYVLACFAFEMVERQAHGVLSLRTVNRIEDPQARAAAQRDRDQRLKAMTESIPYLLYLFWSIGGGLSAFIGGLFWMRPKLRPGLGNPALEHVLYIPLLLIAAAAMMAIMAPPWLVPYVIDGRSWAEFMKDLQAIH